jgi:hypothetical protein
MVVESGELVEYFHRRVAEGHSLFDGVIEKIFFFQLAQMGLQGVIESAGVEDEDLFVMDLQLVPGEQFKEFIEGAETAGKDDGGVGTVVHHLLSGMHIGNDGQFGEALVLVFPGYQDLRDDAHDGPFAGQYGVRDKTHQSRAAASIDQFQFQCRYQFPQFCCMPGKQGIFSCSRSTKNGDGS